MTLNPAQSQKQINSIIFRNTYNNSWGTLATLKANYNLEIVYVDAIGQEHRIEDLLTVAQFLTWNAGCGVPIIARDLPWIAAPTHDDVPGNPGADGSDLINRSHNASTKALCTTLRRFTEEFARNPNSRMIHVARILNDLWCLSTTTIFNEDQWRNLMGDIITRYFNCGPRYEFMLTRLENLKEDKK